MNSDQSDKLFCLSSGLPASKEVEADLLNFVEKGETAATQFFKMRLIEKSSKFHDSMKKLRLKTFESMAVKKVLKSTEKKAIQVKAERNLLGRLLMLSQENDLSLPKLFEYPLGPIPWSIATADGGMVKTSKAQLMHHLEKKSVLSACPSAENCVYVIDGNALLQSCVNLPETFGELAFQIFKCLPKSPEIHFVTDYYNSNSIKSFERNRRGESGCYSLGGPKTRLPRENWKSFLLNAANKVQLINLMLSEWQSDQYACYLTGRKVYFVAGEKCTVIESLDGNVTLASPVQELFSSQEEADTRIVLHCLLAGRSVASNTNIVVRSPDTDVLVILLHYSLAIGGKLLFDTGTGSNRRIIDCSSLCTTLGSPTCAALPSIHAFTGSDFTSSFVRRGKIRPLQLMEKDPEYVNVFASLGKSDQVDEDAMLKIEKFVCSMYGKPSYRDVNKLRYDLFKTRYQPKSANKSFAFDDGLDLSLLPPCRDSLQRHILRCNYVALMWKQSHLAYPQLPPATDSGWKLDCSGNLEIEWNAGDIMPQDLIDVIVLAGTKDENDPGLQVLVCPNDIEEDDEVDNMIDEDFAIDDE